MLCVAGTCAVVTKSTCIVVEHVDRPPIVLGVVQALVNASMGVLLVYLP